MKLKSKPLNKQSVKKAQLTHSSDIVNRKPFSILGPITVKVIGKGVPINTYTSRRFYFFIRTSDEVEFRVNAYRLYDDFVSLSPDPDQVIEITKLRINNFYQSAYTNYPSSLNMRYDLDIKADTQMEIIEWRDFDIFAQWPFIKSNYPPFWFNHVNDLKVNLTNVGMRLRIIKILNDYNELEYTNNDNVDLRKKGITVEVGDNLGYCMNMFILTDAPREVIDLLDNEIVFWAGETIDVENIFYIVVHEDHTQIIEDNLLLKKHEIYKPYQRYFNKRHYEEDEDINFNSNPLKRQKKF